MLVCTAGKSGSCQSSPLCRQAALSRSNSELILLTPSPPSLTSPHHCSRPSPPGVCGRLAGRGSARQERVARRAAWSGVGGGWQGAPTINIILSCSEQSSAEGRGTEMLTAANLELILILYFIQAITIMIFEYGYRL